MNFEFNIPEKQPLTEREFTSLSLLINQTTKNFLQDLRFYTEVYCRYFNHEFIPSLAVSVYKIDDGKVNIILRIPKSIIEVESYSQMEIQELRKQGSYISFRIVVISKERLISFLKEEIFKLKLQGDIQ